MNREIIEREVTQAAAAFVQAFDALDWEPFADCFAEDASIFMPFPGVMQRLDGWDAIAAVFKPFFDKKRSERDAPPYLDLQPLDLMINVLDARAALVTFHLSNKTAWSRRTVVFQKRGSSWLIQHLHASNVNLD